MAHPPLTLEQAGAYAALVQHLNFTVERARALVVQEFKCVNDVARAIKNCVVQKLLFEETLRVFEAAEAPLLVPATLRDAYAHELHATGLVLFGRLEQMFRAEFKEMREKHDAEELAKE